ncbi:Leukocyte antigen CD37 [Bagarius yarrelli]|uniref:Leukocyte antigen CD37 n=1 Tax=Bagarius yarrelli TaxID=175774 RepID=A0A556THK6_BAGYA|nr:Leukocyte antigen CD37 [Bagarius yarrelli]
MHNDSLHVVSAVLDADVKVVAGGLFVVSLVVVGVSVLGCIGVHLENRCIIALYMGLLIAIIFGELFITFLLLLKRSQIKMFLTESVDAIISMYGVNETQSTWTLLDRVQRSAKCCGRQNSSDWRTNQLIQRQNISDVYPCSCFNESCPVFPSDEMYQFGNGTQIYTTGCEEKLNDWFEKNLLVIVGIDLALLIIQILQFILGLHIFRIIVPRIKNKQPENLLGEIEENPALSSDPQQNDLEYHQAYTHTQTHEQPMHSAYNLEPPEQSYYQDTEHQHEYNSPGQRYDSNGRHIYQQHRGPERSHHVCNQKPEDRYARPLAGAGYDQLQKQQYQDDHDLQHRQSYNGNYNQGYTHDDYIRY